MTLMVQFHETLDSRKGLHPFWEAARKCAPRRNGLHPFSEAARKFTSCKFPAALLFGENEVLKKTSCLAPKSQSLPKRDAVRFRRVSFDDRRGQSRRRLDVLPVDANEILKKMCGRAPKGVS